MEAILKDVRGEGKVDDGQAVLEDGHGGIRHHLEHHPLGSVLAGGVEQQQGEKPPWDLSYMREEENSLQLILQEEE